MVKSKSMEVMKAVQEDLGEVKTTMTPVAASVRGAGGSIMNTVKVSFLIVMMMLMILNQELDEVTDDMAEAAINGVTKSASSFWNMASG